MRRLLLVAGVRSDQLAELLVAHVHVGVNLRNVSLALLDELVVVLRTKRVPAVALHDPHRDLLLFVVTARPYPFRDRFGPMRLPALGALSERQFSGTSPGGPPRSSPTACAGGDQFAVLDLTGSASDLGFVLAARMVPVVVLLARGGCGAGSRASVKSQGAAEVW
ncbi:MAG: hypothetical protein ABR583_02725 [Gaiellaceae bacterium]